jgi:hypothetical protein
VDRGLQVVHHRLERVDAAALHREPARVVRLAAAPGLRQRRPEADGVVDARERRVLRVGRDEAPRREGEERLQRRVL